MLQRDTWQRERLNQLRVGRLTDYGQPATLSTGRLWPVSPPRVPVSLLHRVRPVHNGPKGLAHGFAAYWNYQKSRNLYNDLPTVLFVTTTTTTTEARIDRYACRAALGEVTFLLILLTTEHGINDPRNPHRLLGAIRRELVADFDKRRYWLPPPGSDVSEP